MKTLTLSWPVHGLLFLREHLKGQGTSYFCCVLWSSATRGQHCHYCLLELWEPKSIGPVAWMLLPRGAPPPSPSADAPAAGWFEDVHGGWASHLLANMHFLFNVEGERGGKWLRTLSPPT